MADSAILGTHDVLCQELDEIERRRARRVGGTHPPSTTISRRCSSAPSG